MIRPIFLSLFWLVMLAASGAAQSRPNIILIIADDLGYGELGCYGGNDIPTPHIDSLASGGMRFTAGYVTASYCAASRAGLMTGKYQTSFGFEFNPIGPVNTRPGVGLPVSQRTLADDLKDDGYISGLIGKWHLGGAAEFHPQRRGFDEFFGFLHEGHYFVPPPWRGTTTWLRRKSLPQGAEGRWTSADGHTIWSTHMGHNEPPYDADNPILRSSQPVNETQNLTTAFTREACDFIRRHREQPFFLALSYNAVHSPLQGDNRYIEKFSHIDDIQRRIFAAMLSQLDDGVGQVMNSLEENSLSKQTLIIFLSDNGGPTKELTSSNAPLRGGKGSVYEGGIRIPLIVHWRDHVAPSTVNTPVIATDIAATIGDLLEINDSDKDQRQNGISWKGLLADPASDLAPRSLYWRMGNKQAIRSGDWKAVKHGVEAWELYNLKEDISESKDLASRQAARLRQLIQDWEDWNSRQAEPLWR